MTSSTQTLCLVDGSGYLFRAYHAIPNLSTSNGQPTGAVYGVGAMLRQLLAHYPDTYLAVIFDAKGENFRHQLYPVYKANRPAPPEALIAQITLVHELVRALGLPLLCEPGVEADDVIATLTRQACAVGMEVLIFSSDKDLAQLVGDKVWLVDPKNQQRLDAAGICQKYGIPPARMGDYLALMGDKVDNVPGVPNVGPKTAIKWLQEYGDLDNIIANAPRINGKVGENLRAALPELALSRQLVRLRSDVKLAVSPSMLRRAAVDVAALRGLYQRLEFRHWLAELEDVPPAAPVAHYQTIVTLSELQAWIEKLSAAPAFAFDTETTSLNYLDGQIVGVSFATTSGEAAYVPLAHDYPGAPEQLNRVEVLAMLRPLLEDANRAKIGQHWKYDCHILANHGIHPQGPVFDSMLESYVLDAASAENGSGHSMDVLAQRYLHYTPIAFESIAGKGGKQLTFNQVGIEQAAPYAAEDADITLRLHQHLWPKLQATGRLAQVYEQIEQPLIGVLFRMERNGVLIDPHLLRVHSQELAVELQQLEQQAYSEAGQTFNLHSTKQLREILFEQQKLPVLGKTAKGEPSTAESVLRELAEYPLPNLILRHRSLSKLRSTYTERLPSQIHPRTGRVHTSYHQAIAQTGRLSSSDPNLQNIPIRTPQGRRIRQAFIAPPGYVLLAADYSQIELRIMAHLSGDAGLVSAFAAGVDVHRATAAEVFGIVPQQVDAAQRRAAKAINFGLIYGMSAFGLAKQLGISRSVAQAYIDQYFTRYPGVKAYMEQTRAQAADQGYVETVFGRRLFLPEIRSRNAQRRQYAERTAINAPMQGTAADIIKKAMLRLDDWLCSSARPDARMIMQVHDELVFEVAQDQVETVSAHIRNRMIQAADLSVALEVEVGMGNNWEAAH